MDEIRFLELQRAIYAAAATRAVLEGESWRDGPTGRHKIFAALRDSVDDVLSDLKSQSPSQ